MAGVVGANASGGTERSASEVAWPSEMLTSQNEMTLKGEAERDSDPGGDHPDDLDRGQEVDARQA
jgi:hypothetical protein